MDTAQPIKIDIDKILRQRLGAVASLFPSFMVNKLKHLVCQDRLNEMLEKNFPAEGADFCRGVLNHLDVKLEVKGADLLPPPDHKRVIIVSNHPLGGLDGMMMIDFFTRYFDAPVKFVVNDLLMAVKPLAPVFLPINKHGSQSRSSILAIDSEMKGDNPIIIFPAGLVSRQQKKGGPIADLQWQKMFVNKAVEFQRDIVPVYFSGTNSQKFYSAARRRQKLGIKFNFEMILLPSEVFKAEHKTFSINVGKTLPWQSLKAGKHAVEEAAAIKQIVSDLNI